MIVNLPIQRSATSLNRRVQAETKVLVIGYGNELRSDDALGPQVVRTIEERSIPGVRVLVVQQLTPELAEPISRADRVVFVDAAVGQAQAVRVREINISVPEGTQENSQARQCQDGEISMVESREGRMKVWNLPQSSLAGLQMVIRKHPALSCRSILSHAFGMIGARTKQFNRGRRTKEGELSRHPRIETHASNPMVLLALARQLYGHSPPAYVVTIAARELGVGIDLSPEARAGLAEGVHTVAELCQ